MLKIKSKNRIKKTRVVKFLITIFFISSTFSAQSQELDKLYYILGYMRDFSVPLHYSGDLKSSKMAFGINESHLSMVYRFSEVTGLKFKKRKPKKDCFICQEFYEFIDIPRFYKYDNFYDFTYSKSNEYYYGWGEVEVEKQHGFLKPSVLKNITQHQMKSFLAGAYLYSGTIKGDTVSIEFYQAVNQKLALIKEFIDTIEGAKFLKVIPNKKEGEVYGPTLVFVPNKILWDLFKNEEDRMKELVSSFTLSN